MTRSLRPSKVTASMAKSDTVNAGLPALSLKAFNLDTNTTFDVLDRAQREGAAIGNAERPSNMFFRTTNKTPYWYMYALADWYRSEVSIFSTIIQRSVTEIFRYELELRPKFVRKCEDCGYEIQVETKRCPKCQSARLRGPDEKQKEYFTNPHSGKSFLDDANKNHQTLKDVLKMYAASEYQNNQAYTLCVTGDIYDKQTGRLIKAYPLEFINIDAKFIRYLYDDRGTPGTEFAFVRSDRKNIINLSQDPDELDAYSCNGEELYPAFWQVGSSYGGAGEYWLYSEEEIYQDQWFRPSMTYGVPILYDIEDDMLTYHYLEKSKLKRYKFGFVRKMVILPGFTDEDVEDITKGIKDVLETNDNSIPIVCTPPQMPGTAEMKAQVLELDSPGEDVMKDKDDIRTRLCAHWGVPDVFAGDVEASGGMNNESQQITIYDRYLTDKYGFVDRQCRWIMSWFPKITDWELVLDRPSKAYSDRKKRLENMQEAQMMKNLGFDIYYQDGEFHYSEEPLDQIQRKEQEQQQQAMQGTPPQGPVPDGGLMPGDGDGPPEKGTARREDPEIGQTEDDIDLAKREASDAMEI